MSRNQFEGLVKGESIFDLYPNCVRFRITSSTPFPEIPEAVVSTEIWKGEFPVSFRITSSTVKNSEASLGSLKMHGIASTYPSFPSSLNSEIVLDISIPVAGELSRFDSLFGNDLWLHSHTASQEVILWELNRIVDLARHNTEPQYMLRNISVFDMGQQKISEVNDGVEIFKSILFPQVTGGSIDVSLEHVKNRAVLPFYFRNYLDARRHFSEFRFRELQIAASNSIEAGSWFLWDLAKPKLTLPAGPSDHMQRFKVVSKAIRNEMKEENGVPTKAINRVWKRRQKAMHGEEVIMSHADAASVLTHLGKVMDYVDRTGNLLRS
ncbi:hypothetical protein WNY61_08155 [Sulfitobacter sp. AS92]|uniref:hypothetical protein n=1 Tax=Sulfitobacter sp. AS92 TaxID=3135783 RepID=UPI00316B6CE3